MTEDNDICSHLSAMTKVRHSNSHECAECIKTNSEWVHLRTCQTCGVTLCCDLSPEKHMTRHYHETNHPVISSEEPGERWLWCYPDEQMVEY